MASVISKRVNGRTYYYLAESARVHGKPRVVAQRYLGTAEEIASSLGGPAAEPEHTRHLYFGDVAAVWRTMRRLKIANRVDEIVGRQRARVSVGTYVALAVLHRVTAPGSELAQWWSQTAADRFVRPALPQEAFERGRFAKVARRVTPAHRERIEAAVCADVRDRIDPGHCGVSALVVDVPSFATFEDAEPAEASPLGVSLAVTKEGAIPLAAHGYRRDGTGDAPLAMVAERLAYRHRQRTDSREVTVIFDAAQHAVLNLDSGLRFIGGLPPGDHPELLAQPATVHAVVDEQRFPGLRALDTRAVILGANRRVIVTHSRTLHAAQARGFAQALHNATRQLDGLAEALRAGTYRASREHVLTEIARITRVRWVDRVLATTLRGTKPGELRLRWSVDESAWERLDQEFFGKRLLVTDHDDWSVSDVVTAYRARYHLDDSFRRLNDPYVAAVTGNERARDERVSLHQLISVLAATVLHLMRHEADRSGVDLSVRDLLTELAGIQETSLRYPSTGGRPRTRRVLTDRTAMQQRLFDLFDLHDYAPRHTA